MLLNDVQPQKRLAFLLGVQIERHILRGGSGATVAIVMASVVAMGLVLASYYISLP